MKSANAMQKKKKQEKCKKNFNWQSQLKWEQSEVNQKVMA